MKKCLACLHENSDEMSFCLNCGKPLAESHPPGWLGDAPTTAFNEVQTTVRRGSFETRPIPQQFTAAPKAGTSSKKLVLALAAGAGLVLLMVVAGAAIVGYNIYSKSQGGKNPTPVPTMSGTPTTPNKNGTPSASATPTPNASFTPPVIPTKTGKFTVFANGGWQLSDIDTVALEEFRTKIDGKVDVSGVKTGISASGVNDAASKSRRIYPEFPTGALLMRTHYADGKFSNVMAMAARGTNGNWRNFQDEIGKLEFCINDNSPAQNGGQFTVTATMTKVPNAKK